MIKLEHNNSDTLKFFKSLFNTMIPESDDGKIPKLSDAIDLPNLLKIFFLDKNLKKKLNEMLLPIFDNYKKTQDLDYSNLGKIIAESRKIENLIERYLLEAYFTSTLVKDALSKKTNVLLSANKIKKKDDFTLHRQIKNSRPRYKKI